DEIDVLRRIEKTVRRAVQWNEALTRFDVFEQRLFLLSADFREVRVNQQAVVFRQRLGVERLGAIGVPQLDTAFFEHRMQLAKTVTWLVMPIVAEEENLDRRRLGRQRRGADQRQCEREKTGSHVSIPDSKTDV